MRCSYLHPLVQQIGNETIPLSPFPLLHRRWSIHRIPSNTHPAGSGLLLNHCSLSNTRQVAWWLSRRGQGRTEGRRKAALQLRWRLREQLNLLRLPEVCSAAQAAAGTINITQHSNGSSGDRRLPASLKGVSSGERYVLPLLESGGFSQYHEL